MGSYPYKTFARKETHPARMGALARLSGIEAADSNECRVLELGCGNGGNIIPMALANPRSTYVGIDRERGLIETGRQICSDLGLGNIELIAADIAEYQPEASAFDYIICHGVYSWVSSDLQRRILEVVKRCLAPHGVCFVSYNTLPGWRQRGVLRDIFQVGALHAGGNDEESRYAAGMQLLSKLTSEPTMLPTYVTEAAARLATSEPSYVAQEFLGDYNSPVLFIDFMRGAQELGLQFLSEARVVMMSSEDLSPELNSLLDSFGEDLWMREQVLDLIRNRTFRETLLCHDSIVVNRGLSVRAFKELVFITNYIPLEPSSNENSQESRFKERSSDREIVAPHGECERLLRVIGERGPLGVAFSELQGSLGAPLGFSETELTRALVTLWKTGFVDACQRVLCLPCNEARATPLARAQALSGEKVATPLHESFDLPRLERRALGRLEKPISFQALETLMLHDGSREEVLNAIQNLTEKGFWGRT